MKTTILLIATILCCSNFTYGQENHNWDKWERFMGNWLGEGSGTPGQGGGTFSFTPDLDKNVLVRRSHSEYPSPEGRIVVHEDLMVIYQDSEKKRAKAIYFDNEGHIINYSISYPDTAIILTSERVPDSPVFRLVYSMADAETCITRFEFSQDGEKFTTYIEGESKRIK